MGQGFSLAPNPFLATGLGAVGPAGERGQDWKGLKQAKANKSAAGPGWLTSQTTVFDSLLLPCQVQLLPHSHPLAGGARGDVGFLRSGGEGGCRGEQQQEGLAPHGFFSALLSFIPLPVERQEGAGGDVAGCGGVMLPGSLVPAPGGTSLLPSSEGGEGMRGAEMHPQGWAALPSLAVCLQRGTLKGGSFPAGWVPVGRSSPLPPLQLLYSLSQGSQGWSPASLTSLLQPHLGMESDPVTWQGGILCGAGPPTTPG